MTYLPLACAILITQFVALGVISMYYERFEHAKCFLLLAIIVAILSP